jgi:bacillopeptidase F (M6 metalloprotease family)
LLNKKLFFIDKLIYEILNTNLDKHIENKNKYSVDLQASIVERVKQFHPKFIGIKKKVIEE